MKRSFLFSILFAVSLSSAFAVETPAELTWNQKAEAAFKRAAWDESEKLYLKAAESYRIDDRIKAYKGLVELYGKLRLEKKKARAQVKLDADKAFLNKLVPKEKSFYESYTVKKGETYGRIAYRNEISEEWLKRANKRKRLLEGSKIKLPKVKDHITVDKKKRTLVWKRGNQLVKTYSISIGAKESETPEGEFKITEKVVNPIWYHEGREIPPDSEENLLGTRWLGFDKKSYAIHGTRHPGLIGQAVSHGCVRMLNREVEELFEWVQVGTKVTIHNGKKSL